ncbi:hypothetical protein D0Z08_01115 [Nocardioides immobilis]|uniref:Uncharacterized protein n=1 Tax=Nocardioides immobilis TaxID=2049295 RepID=A0A417Y7E2_9ACTN|nr:hypothetical protein [Nocardioides immobilis]RHW28505.1 hypothetical protein D0Z08_01115 [Nocardioides immobilis]
MSVTSRPESRALPRYFVSARHGRIERSADGAGNWQPFGSHHAREVGAPTTACGLPAHDWRMFWELPFPSSTGALCHHCMAAVAPPEVRPLPRAAAGGRR